MKLNSKSRILSASHWDMDGSTCQIVLGNYFENIEYHSATFTNIDHMMKTMAPNFHKYDAVILTDVYPKDPELLEYNNIILLDHHETDEHHNPKLNRYVLQDNCAAVLTQNWVETEFDVDISYLNELVRLVNDYDLWIHNDPKSKQLNELFDLYRETKFRKRFFDGDVEFNQREIDHIEQRSKQLATMWEELDVFEFKKINACLVQIDDFPNEICERLYSQEGYDVVFAKNTKNGNISVRTGRDDIHLGKLFTDLDIGGGHAKASGLRGHSNNIESLKLVIEMVEKAMYQQWPQIRKKGNK